MRSEVRARIGRLAGDPDPASEAGVARALAAALGDPRPESRATFAGLAGGVRRGELAEDCLQWAFEVACGRRIRNRGAAFVAAVRRWLSSHGREGPADRAGTVGGRSCGLDVARAGVCHPRGAGAGD